MRGKLYVVSGPSGAGKGTVCRRLLDARSDIYFSVSATTRAIRPGEVDGVHYHYLAEEAFLALRDQNGLLESSHHAGAWYGTPRQAALDHMNAGQNVLLEIENNGAMQVIASYPETISVFILPPSRAVLLNRLVRRGTENMDKLRGRVMKIPSELIAAHDYSCLVLNDQVETAVAHLSAIFDGTYDGRAENMALLNQLQAEFDDLDEAFSALSDIYTQYQLEKTQDQGGVNP